MAIIVYHKKAKAEYILLGVGFGAFKSARSNAFLHFVPTEEEGQFEVVALSDSSGNIRWAHASDLRVIEVDEQAPASLLSDFAQRADRRGQPATVSEDDIEGFLSEDST